MSRNGDYTTENLLDLLVKIYQDKQIQISLNKLILQEH